MTLRDKRGDDFVFPSSHEAEELGLTIREHAAIEAMKGILSDRSAWPSAWFENHVEAIAERSVTIADALIERLGR